jgi:5-oxoprolinase (ATP-hydrolysing)
MWRISLDTGGTFTDCIAVDPDGLLRRAKVLSSGSLRGRITGRRSACEWFTDLRCPCSSDIFEGYQLLLTQGRQRRFEIASIDVPSGIVRLRQRARSLTGMSFEITAHEEVPLFACRLLTETPLNAPLPPISLRLGSTRGTNALLERKGARTAFLVTRGYRDLLTIGTQQRERLFAVHIEKQPPLYADVIEVNERLEANGSILQPLTRDEVRRVVQIIRRGGFESVAVAFLHSYRNPEHEQRMEDALFKAGFRYCSLSSSLSGQIKILTRATTAVVNAYLDPIITRYLDQIRKAGGIRSLMIMSSAGGLVASTSFHPKDSLLSGPAGGVVGAARAAGSAGISRFISFDMGGTSTDVSLYDDRPEYRHETRVGNHRLFSPSLGIETIAAGGGSICDFDGYRFTVGPESAGASPGPACYGAGGPLTITDVNLLLGRMDAGLFAFSLSSAKSGEALDRVLAKVRRTTKKEVSAAEALTAFISIANEKMAEAIRQVSVKQGHNPGDFTLLSFGGAGGQHACTLATMLRIRNVVVPFEAGLLSASGISAAPVERFAELQLLLPLDEARLSLEKRFRELDRNVLRELRRTGHASSEVRISHRWIFLRLSGQETSLEVEYSRLNNLESLFRKKYTAVYGHWIHNRTIEIESIRVKGTTRPVKPLWRKRHLPGHRPAESHAIPYLSEKLKPGRLPVYRWEALRPGARIAGPALLCSHNSTTYVEREWECRIDASHSAVLTARKFTYTRAKYPQEALLELYSNRFTAIAKDMGTLLERTAFSVNVKERLDFSCALLDARGYLIVNAPHIPVHLGSLGACVRAVAQKIHMGPGDVVITNHPAFGGSHLPDVTLIRPVFAGKALIGYVANRAHHAEIGGRTPGSMPADAISLQEEGVVIAPRRLVSRGRVQWGMIRKLLTEGIYPSRLPEENLADLRAGLAALTAGDKALRALAEAAGNKEVMKFMSAIRRHASAQMSEKLKELADRKLHAEERLDDGSLLRVSVAVRAGTMVIDFSGSAGVHPGNLNATPAIVQSVVLYVLRLLVNRPVPLNEGLMQKVRVRLPPGLLNPVFGADPESPAIVGGNTEVSQRLADTLLKAFGLAACSQGTMNNFLFGNERFGYYETICGGTGAGPGFNGSDAVHQHMTNTRITDPEILEHRYPVRLLRFAIRKNSGGAGRWRGGDGVEREFLFRTSLEINILSQHRVISPYGLNGGKPGKTGQQYLLLSNGKRKTLRGIDRAEVQPADRLVIRTPGGGGYGRA